MNSFICIGNLTKDSTVKANKAGDKNFNVFTVAINNGKNQDGTERTMFVDVFHRAFGDNAVAQYLKKGTKVAVQGSIDVTAWLDNDGNPRTNLRCQADRVELCGQKEQTQEAAAPARSYDDGGKVAPPEESTSELPF